MGKKTEQSVDGLEEQVPSEVHQTKTTKEGSIESPVTEVGKARKVDAEQNGFRESAPEEGKHRSQLRKQLEHVTEHTGAMVKEVQKHTETAGEHVKATAGKVRVAAQTAAGKTQEISSDAAGKTREMVAVVAEKARDEARLGVLKIKKIDLNRKRKRMLTELGGEILDLIEAGTRDVYGNDSILEILQNVKDCDQQIEQTIVEMAQISTHEQSQDHSTSSDQEDISHPKASLADDDPKATPSQKRKGSRKTSSRTTSSKGTIPGSGTAGPKNG